ncbi:hypothetical protein KM043_002233 [Ampulex compressa]|nr:hypothetical protein KM043_002233 [Ampulex compressa]
MRLAGNRLASSSFPSPPRLFAALPSSALPFSLGPNRGRKSTGIGECQEQQDVGAMRDGGPLKRERAKHTLGCVLELHGRRDRSCSCGILPGSTLFSRNKVGAGTPTPQGPDRLRRRLTGAG